MKKIKVFTNHYHPENFKINDIVEELQKDYVVDVVTQNPNYPSGKLIKGYSKFTKSVNFEKGIKVTRLPVIPRGKNSLMLSLNYISYLITSTFYSLFNRDKVDHVLVYVTSPIYIAWAGLRTAKRAGATSTLYLLDLWPGSLISILNIKNKSVKKHLVNMSSKIYKQFDTIIVSSQGFIEVLEGYGVEKEKIHYIPQNAEMDNEEKVSVKKSSNESLKIVFTGNIGEAQNLDLLVNAAHILNDKNIKNIQFTIVGDGRYREALENNVKNKKLEDYFEFTGRVPASEIRGILSKHHFGYVSLKDDETFNRTLPAKVQTYMNLGIPVLAAAEGEIPRIISEANCGVSIGPCSPDEVAQFLIELRDIDEETLRKMSDNGIIYSRKNFDMDVIYPKIKELIDKGDKD